MSPPIIFILRLLIIPTSLLLWIPIKPTFGQPTSERRGAVISGEFCERESFEASCGTDEVILMRSAKYGRMKYGKCVQTEYGAIGCSADVLRTVDLWCSGRKQCRFPITDLHDSKHCPRELIAYLEASYECVTVSQCPDKACAAGESARISSTSGEGYLASSVTATSGCGSFSCPWVIEAKRGQRLNMTFYSFLVLDELQQQQQQQLNKFCHRLAVITDPSTHLSKDVTLCNKDNRVINQQTSAETVHVKMYPGSPSKPANFIIHYQAVGCPNFEKPPGGWVRREGNLVTVGCNDKQRTWHLTCDGVTWVGQISDCDKATTDLTASWNVHSALEKAKSTTEGILMVVGLGVFIGVVTGCSMLTVVIIIIKRRRRRMALQYERRREAKYSYDGATIPGHDKLYMRKQLCGDKEVSAGLTAYDQADYDRTPYETGGGGACIADGETLSYLCSNHVNARFRPHDVGAQMMTLATNVSGLASSNDFGKEHAYETPNFST